MKNKYIIIAGACLFLIVAGLCYSHTYKKNHEQEIMLLSNDQDEGSSKDKLDDEDIINTVDSLQLGNREQQIGFNEEAKGTKIYVHICGAVVNPDVYQVAEGTRLVDLIDAAGGLTPEAADDYINQAMKAEDGQKVYIPTQDELKDFSIAEYAAGDNNIQSDKRADIKVNINSADETELMSLPGIGQAKAKSIIEYRKKNGSFETIDDLMNISGIKEVLFAQIKDLVVVK